MIAKKKILTGLFLLISSCLPTSRAASPTALHASDVVLSTPTIETIQRTPAPTPFDVATPVPYVSPTATWRPLLEMTPVEVGLATLPPPPDPNEEALEDFVFIFPGEHTCRDLELFLDEYRDDLARAVFKDFGLIIYYYRDTLVLPAGFHQIRITDVDVQETCIKADRVLQPGSYYARYDVDIFEDQDLDTLVNSGSAFIEITVTGSLCTKLTPGDEISQVQHAQAGFFGDEYSPELVRVGRPGSVLKANWSPNGSTVVVSISTGLAAHDPETLDERWYLDLEAPLGIFNFNPDGSMLAGGTLGELIILDLKTGDILRRFAVNPYGISPSAVAFHPDGVQIAVAIVNEIQIWDASTAKLLQTISGEFAGANVVSFGEDESEILVVVQKSVMIWDADNGELKRTFDLPVRNNPRTESLFVSGDRRFLIYTGDDGFIRYWSISDGSFIREIEVGNPGFEIPAVSPNGLTAASGNISILDAEFGNLLCQLRDLASPLSFPHNLVFSPDGRKLMSYGDDNRLKVWDLINGTLFAVIDFSRP